MILRCYVDDRTQMVLELEAKERGLTVEALAEAAIENAASQSRHWRGDAPRNTPAAYIGGRDP